MPEYWIVNPVSDRIRVFRLENGLYALSQELSLERGDMLTSPLRPGLEMPLAETFDD